MNPVYLKQNDDDDRKLLETKACLLQRTQSSNPGTRKLFYNRRVTIILIEVRDRC